MSNVKTLLSNLFLSLLAILFIFIILEVSAEIYILNFAEEQSFKKYASLKQIHYKKDKLKYTPHPYLRYYPTPNYISGNNKHNSLGYRGDEIDMPKPDGRFRIVCLGGSTTYTNEIDDYKMSYPYHLEEKLKKRGYENIDVVNAGVSGWTSWESLINFELRILDLEPDMIIIYHGINDIHARLVWPPEAYKGDNTGEISTTSFMTMPSIFEYSTLLRILMIKLGITDSHSAIERLGRSAGKGTNTYFAPQFQYQNFAGTYPSGIFKSVSAKYMLKTNTPKYFKRNIGNIVAIAKDNGITTVLTSFAYSPLFKKQPRVASEEYISAYAEMNSTLKDIASEREVHFFDFANIFPNDKQYYVDGRHVNEKGARLKAELFAEYLVANELVPR